MLYKNNSFRITTLLLFGIFSCDVLTKGSCMESGLEEEKYTDTQDKKIKILSSYTTKELITLTVMMGRKFEAGSCYNLLFLIEKKTQITLRKAMINNLVECNLSLLKEKLSLLRSYIARIGKDIIFDKEKNYCYVVKDSLSWRNKYKENKDYSYSKIGKTPEESTKIYFVLQEIEDKMVANLLSYAKGQMPNFTFIKQYNSMTGNNLSDGMIGFKNTFSYLKNGNNYEKEKVFVLYATSFDPTKEIIKPKDPNSEYIYGISESEDPIMYRIKKAIMVVSIFDPLGLPIFSNVGITRLYYHIECKNNESYTKYLLGDLGELKVTLSMAMHAMSTQMVPYYLKQQGYKPIKKEFMITSPTTIMSNILSTCLGQQFVAIGSGSRREKILSRSDEIRTIDQCLAQGKPIPKKYIEQFCQMYGLDNPKEAEVRKNIQSENDYSITFLKNLKNICIQPVKSVEWGKYIDITWLDGKTKRVKGPNYLRCHENLNSSDWVLQTLISADALAALLPTGDKKDFSSPSSDNSPPSYSPSSLCQII